MYALLDLRRGRVCTLWKSFFCESEAENGGFCRLPPDQAISHGKDSMLLEFLK
jgi:hypothetical protein